MELGPSSSSTRAECGCTVELLSRVCALRQPPITFVVHNAERKWSQLFTEFVLHSRHCTDGAKCAAHSDDMLWYVPIVRMSASFYVGSSQSSHILQVFRRESRGQPHPGDPCFAWEETVCLNIILQQLDFHVTCAVCTKTSPQNLQILRKNCQRVYPSPSRRRMDSKGEGEEITYPKIYFAIDDFEQVFNDVIVRDGECVCVELVARDRSRKREAVVFLGSIRYEVLKQVYDARASATWQWAQKLMSSGQRRQEFVRMRGPHGKGYAEMAVARVPNCGFETPVTDRPFDQVETIEQYRRRMSDTNLSRNRPPTSFTPASPSPFTLNPRSGRRWQSETDTASQYPEVEANSIDDELEEGVLSRLWSVRGFGQAWHWLREKRRAECTPLNAYLTYVTLPWTTILDDFLLDRPRRPILSFDLDLQRHMTT